MTEDPLRCPVCGLPDWQDPDSPHECPEGFQVADFMEEGRRLASEREDLIAAGVDPAELAVPLAPLGPVRCPDCGHSWGTHEPGGCEGPGDDGGPCGCTTRLPDPRAPLGRTGPDRPVCLCVADHRPAYTEPEWHHILPLGMGGPDTPRGRLGENGVWLCSNAHTNVHEVLRMILKRSGALTYGEGHELWPGLNRYAFALAHEGYRRFMLMHGPTTT